VTKHEFIFSTQRKQRIARHIIFWLVWWLSFAIFFHWPIHTFNGWNIRESANPDIERIGFLRLILKTLFINSLLAVILPQIGLCYLLIYWLLPNYFFRKRNFLVAIFVITGVLAIYLFVAAVFKYSVPLFNYILGTIKSLQPFKFTGLLQIAITDQVTTLPIVAGVAVMIKLVKRWWWKQKETEQLAKEKTKAELQLLKAQIHPHFLFNTLNNIYFFTITNSIKAPEMIQKLGGMLRYILNECNQPLVAVNKEIKMIQDYMALEKVRYGEQLQMTIEIPENDPGKMIAPLLLIPFVENSFKHGASKMIIHPWIRLHIGIENDFLYFCVSNSRPPTNELLQLKGNIGLKNVKKRLQLLYPEGHILTINEEVESFTVHLKIELKEIAAPHADIKEMKPTGSYAMA
jgi:sensor histidine kinase YesM